MSDPSELPVLIEDRRIICGWADEDDGIGAKIAYLDWRDDKRAVNFDEVVTEVVVIGPDDLDPEYGTPGDRERALAIGRAWRASMIYHQL